MRVQEDNTHSMFHTCEGHSRRPVLPTLILLNAEGFVEDVVMCDQQALSIIEDVVGSSF